MFLAMSNLGSGTKFSTAKKKQKVKHSGKRKSDKRKSGKRSSGEPASKKTKTTAQIDLPEMSTLTAILMQSQRLPTCDHTNRARATGQNESSTQHSVPHAVFLQKR